MVNIDYEELYFNPPIIEWVNGKMKIIKKKIIKTETREPKKPKTPKKYKKEKKQVIEKYKSKDTNNKVFF